MISWEDTGSRKLTFWLTCVCCFCPGLQDKDGVISVRDLRIALTEMGEKVSDDELRELIAEVDINKNYTIEEEEFLQVCMRVEG